MALADRQFHDLVAEAVDWKRCQRRRQQLCSGCGEFVDVQADPELLRKRYRPLQTTCGPLQSNGCTMPPDSTDSQRLDKREAPAREAMMGSRETLAS